MPAEAASCVRASVAAKRLPSPEVTTVRSDPAPMPVRAGSGGRASVSKHISGAVLGEMAGVRHEDRQQLRRGANAETARPAPMLAEAVGVVASGPRSVHEDRHGVPGVRGHLRGGGVIAGYG